MMLGLTLIQPMGWAIVHRFKPYENRVRDMRPLSMRGVRTQVAIHNGAKWDDSYALMIRELTGIIPPAVPMAVIGVATFTGRLYSLTDPPPKTARGIEWFFGPFAFEIDTSESVILPTPVPCRGMQGFWKLPEAVEAKVREQLELKLCIDCGDVLPAGDVAQGFTTCETCARDRRAAR